MAALAACANPPDEVVVLRLTARPRPPTAAAPAIAPTAVSAPAAGTAARTAASGAAAAPPAAQAAGSSPPTAAAPNPAAPAAPTPGPRAAVDLDGAAGWLVEVIDGDTVTIAVDGGQATVRILGIDAPELDDRAGQRGLAAQAREALRALVGRGPLRLVADAEPTDDGGRLLRHAFLGERLLAADLARQGWARALPVAPNLAHQNAIAAAAAQARQDGVGIWALTAVDLTLTVDKAEEIAALSTAGGAPVDVSGWWLVSLRGAQVFTFPAGSVVAPGAPLTVAAGKAAGALRFGRSPVWSNGSRDPGELRRPDGRIAAVWDDAG